MRYSFYYLSGSIITLMMLFYYLKGIYFLFLQKRYVIISVYFSVVTLSIIAASKVLNIEDRHLRMWYFIGLLVNYLILFLFPLIFLPSKTSESSFYIKGLWLNFALIVLGIGAWTAGLFFKSMTGVSILLLMIFMFSFFIGSYNLILKLRYPTDTHIRL